MQYKAHGADFGAIITDNDMPQINGLEFIRVVRKEGFKGSIIVASGHLKPETLHAYEPYAISGFFQKPFE